MCQQDIIPCSSIMPQIIIFLNKNCLSHYQISLNFKFIPQKCRRTNSGVTRKWRNGQIQVFHYGCLPKKKNNSGVGEAGFLEDRVIISIFRKSSGSFPLGPESESVELLDFKHLGVDAPAHSTVVSGEKKEDIREILVHQARYMIFENCELSYPLLPTVAPQTIAE